MKRLARCKLHFVTKIIICMQVISCLLGSVSPITAYAAEDESLKVKVGFFARNGYHVENENGTRSGYGYEVLQLMARYSNLSYDYVGYNKTRSEAFEMLRNGEIDILTSVHKGSERMEEFIFSEIDIGVCNTMMTVKAGNTEIQAGDYETYEGIRVGLMNDDVHDEYFHDYAQDKGFSYTPVYYDTVAEIVAALEAEEIDAGATTSVRILGENEWYLEDFHEEEMYVVVRKGNEELLEVVNNALEKLDFNEPDWRLRLLEKYFPKDQGHLLNFSCEELEYLAEIKEKGEVFHVLVNPDRYPYSYIGEDGQYKGIMVDVFANLAEKAGVDYEYIMVENRRDYVEVLKSGQPDICIDCNDDFSTAENQGYRITDTYMKISYSWLYRSDHTGVIKKGARLSFSSVKDSVKDMFGDIEYVDYLYEEHAIEAVRNGTVEGYSTNTLHAEKIIWEDSRNELQATVRPNTVDFTIGTAIRMDNRLLSILNKAVNNMDEELVEEIKADYSYLGKKEFSLERMLYEYPWALLIIITLVIIILLFVIYIKLQKKYNDKILKEAEATKKANQAKTDFISRMSHDIRTPINGIVGMIEVARRNIDDKEKVKECLVKMFVASKHLGSLVNDVLNVAKLDSDKESSKTEPFNMNDQLEYSMDIVNGKMYGRELKFEYDFKQIKHPYLIGSPLYLNEILINILGNCIKYTKDGGSICFHVEEKEHKDEKKAAFHFVMSDTGIGMSKEFLKKIYEPFTQETTSSRTNYEGTGLGMTIVKNLLEKMGGTMEVESELGVGSRFSVYLEFTIDKETEAAELALAEEAKIQGLGSEKPEEDVPDDLSGITVLVVDDVELNIEIVQSILEDEGATVLTAYDGKEAADVFAASAIGSIDLVLMDIRMPVMDGIEATRTIRNMDRPDAKLVYIMAMSANSFEADAEKSKDAGMDGHMNKPIDVMELISTVASCRKKKY
uniref:transporter substrate-binding domain-containing protein n=1 Tax=Agathobacter sp. TaxID=2021311 RepID=UPI00405604B8